MKETKLCSSFSIQENWFWKHFQMVPDSSGEEWMFLIPNWFDSELPQLLDNLFMKKTAPSSFIQLRPNKRWAGFHWDEEHAACNSTALTTVLSGCFMPHRFHCSACSSDISDRLRINSNVPWRERQILKWTPHNNVAEVNETAGTFGLAADFNIKMERSSMG